MKFVDNKNHPRAYGDIEDTPKNRALLVSWGYVIVQDEYVLGYDGKFYIKGTEPEKPTPTKDEQKEAREAAYQNGVDPITCHISRLMDEEQTDEIMAEISALKAERAAKVAGIKAAYPYLEEATDE